MLRFLAAVLRAKAAVEIGTAAEGTCATVRGMAEDGVLTSIDVDPQAQRKARLALDQAGIPHSRVRLISGAAREVLPRLTEGGYDLVTVRTATTEPAAYLDLGLRLLRPGGVVAFDGVRADGADGARLTAGARELLGAVRAQEELVPLALPVGTGMLAVARSA
ncbi:O-methyltransferase [Salinifilum aidingensis]